MCESVWKKEGQPQQTSASMSDIRDAERKSAQDPLRYSIGYRLPDERDSIVNIVRDYRGHIEEVYFAPPFEPSGRSPVGALEGYAPEDVGEIMAEELSELKEMGVRLTMLCNANCYGSGAASKTLADRLEALVGDMTETYGVSAVTTASPYIAMVLKRTFPELQLRASVNMRIGTVNAMRCLDEYFDGFYMQREYNRDFDTIRRLRKYCDTHGKELFLLVNSGCLAFCPFQTFHDNLVAHEAEIDQNDFNMDSPSPCRDYMKNKDHHEDYLRATWIRPEDIYHYRGLFDGYKLATRISFSPRRIVAAYCRGRHRGNLADLTEPGFGFGGYFLDNSRFPEDWFERTSTCKRHCETCDYCTQTYKAVRMNILELERKYMQ